MAASRLGMHRCRWIGWILRPALLLVSVHGTAAVGSALIGHVLTLERVPRPVPTGCLVPVDMVPRIRRHLNERRIPAATLTS